ncbi:MAG: NADPH-dependent F420 reductase [Acidobacteriota bacterium]
MDQTIAILGVGRVGGALAQTFTRAGYAVRLGVRPSADVTDVLKRCHGWAQAAPVRDAAAAADVVFLTVPAASARDAAREAGDLTGKVLVDCTNPVVWQDGPVLAPPPEGSVAAALAAALPGVKVVKGFNTFGAEIHLDPSVAGLPAEVYLAGDDGGALEIVGAIASRSGFAPIAVGPLRNAAHLEALAVLWIGLATQGGQGRGFIFRIARR